MARRSKVSWRTKQLSRPKYFTPKFVPAKVERVVYPVPEVGSDGESAQESNWRIPPRVLISAIPYERVLQATVDAFSVVLPERHITALRRNLAMSQHNMYQRLVKRPICTGELVGPPVQRHMEFEDWVEHKIRIMKLAEPRKNWDEIFENNMIPRPKKPMVELLPGILKLSALQPWKVELLKEVEKDITKVNSKALLYNPSPRVEELAKPKKVEDCSIEGTLRTQILERFEKKLENELLKRRALAKMNYKRV